MCEEHSLGIIMEDDVDVFEKPFSDTRWMVTFLRSRVDAESPGALNEIPTLGSLSIQAELQRMTNGRRQVACAQR